MRAPPFIVFALPRSRTAWTSHYLSHGGAIVGHDAAIYCGKLADFSDNFTAGMAGTVETGAIVGWRAIRAKLPDARFAAITRPLDEVRASLAHVGLTPIDGELERRRALLDEMAEAEGCPVFAFHDLTWPEVRGDLFRYCRGEPVSPAWDRHMAARNVQIDMGERIETLIRNRHRIAALKAEVAA